MAYVWHIVAAENGDDYGLEGRDKVAKKHDESELK